MNNRSIPNATVIPVLRYPDVPVAVEWLCRTFGLVIDHSVMVRVADMDPAAWGGAMVQSEGGA